MEWLGRYAQYSGIGPICPGRGGEVHGGDRARACANQFLPYSSSGIALLGMRTVQADSCLDSEQNNTLFISVGGHFGPEAQNLDMPVYDFFFTASCI